MPCDGNQQADNRIGAEGARALSEALKTNTTLQSLYLDGEQEKSEEDGRIADIANNQHQQTANNIGDEGARALSDALKVNTTLHTLDLEGEEEESGQDKMALMKKSRTWLSACEGRSEGQHWRAFPEPRVVSDNLAKIKGWEEAH